ncbi:hypothetical protein [Allomuricauda sp. d1]|uniref:hypothetical protein n=1 Tax=Allomuricauda sp. d1 TaxID=3136725 RepID=UPI0031D8EA52
MKKTLLLILFLTFSSYCIGQMAKNELYGKWKVQRVVKKSPKPEFRALLDGFGKATFIFHENGDFNLTTESKAPMFQIILQMTKDSKWIFDDKAQLIKIGKEEDGYSIMGIHPTMKDATIEFAMDESEMVFEVKKLVVNNGSDNE